jgi:hypothetical protein
MLLLYVITKGDDNMRTILKASVKTYNVGNKKHTKLFVYIPKLFREALQLKPKEEVQLILKGKNIIISKINNNKE